MICANSDFRCASIAPKQDFGHGGGAPNRPKTVRRASPHTPPGTGAELAHPCADLRQFQIHANWRELTQMGAPTVPETQHRHKD